MLILAIANYKFHVHENNLLFSLCFGYIVYIVYIVYIFFSNTPIFFSSYIL